MAYGTRAAQEAKKMEEAIRLLKEGSERNAKEIGEIKKSLRDLGDIKEMIVAMSMKHDQMARHVYGKPHQEGSGGSRVQQQDLPLEPDQSEFQIMGEYPVRTENTHHNSFPFHQRFAKVEFLRFFGKNPSGWLYKCERFFEYNLVNNGDKVKLAALHLEGSSLQWFQWFEKCHHHFTWDLFKQGLLSRFGPNSYEDAMGELTKLRQTTTVKAYQERFEVLANQTHNLPESFFVSCFISGLKEEIRPGVLMFKPASITNAIGLAKLQESSIEAITRRSRMGNRQDVTMGDKLAMGSGGQFRKELPKELEDKRARGLCFKCNEKYTRGDIRSKKQLYVMEGEEEEQKQNFEGEEEENEEQAPEEELQISLVRFLIEQWG